MSLDKTIEHGKEKRKPYRGSEAFDRSCRNHGGDPWDVEDRQYSRIKKDMEANEQLKEIEL